ncbi:sugar phosphate isomerase/epimerase family protein [Pasteurellaceae bacterium 22721_9_1]
MNNISISNIAWEVSEDSQVIDLLNQYQINKIDIAPSKYFSDFSSVSEEDILRIKDFWNKNGFELIGMQALLFGTKGLNIFASDEIQTKMLDHLNNVCRIGRLLGANKLVFGSPKNRDITGFSDEKVRSISKVFFNRLGDIAEKNQCIICLEPNPVCYGANFMTNSLETLDIVKMVEHPAIKMQLDLGAVTINQEDIEQVLKSTSSYIGHIHISEPELDIIGSSKINHREYAKAISAYIPNQVLTIEMRSNNVRSNLERIEQALKCVAESYQ